MANSRKGNQKLLNFKNKGMKHLFVTYEIALLAKEKGFNETCFAFYKDGELKMVQIHNFDSLIQATNTSKTILDFYQIACFAPLYEQVIQWLQLDHGVLVYPKYQRFNSEPEYWIKTRNEADLLCVTIDKALTEAFKLIP